MTREGYEVRELRAEDRPSLERTVERAFHGVQPGRRLEAPDTWRWRFLDQPCGPLARVAVHGGRVVGQYAAVGLPTWIDGRSVIFAQARDVVLDPDHRRGHGHPGLFVRMVRAFDEAYGGDGGVLVTFGFPDVKTGDLARILLGCDVVRTQTLLLGEVASAADEVPSGVERIERFDHQARWLWERCCGPWGASTVRDAELLNWRYADAPGSPYEVFGVRDAEGVLRGYAVYRADARVVPGAATLVDWLVPPEEPEVAELLLGAVTTRAKADRALALLTLFPEWSPWFADFQARGFLVHPSHLVLTSRSGSRRFGNLWLRDHWWYQLGDTTLA